MTSTDLELYESGNGTLTERDIVEWWAGGDVLGQMTMFANTVCDTEFVPKKYRGNPPAIVACWMTGRELGIGPMTALKHIQIVEGTPSLSAEYKRGRVLAKGHEYKILKLTDQECIVAGRRKGQGEWTEFSYKLADARRANLVKARGSYETRPRRMLLARASSDMCDAMFPEVVNGMPTAELVADGEYGGDDITVPSTAAEAAEAEQQPVKRRGRPRRTAELVENVAENEEEASAAAEPEPASAPAKRRGRPRKVPVAQPEPEPASVPAEDEDGEADDLLDEVPDDDWGADEPADAEAAQGGSLDANTDEADGELMMTEPQHKRIEAQFGNLRIKSRDEVHRVASRIAGVEIGSMSELTQDQASEITDVLGAALGKENPRAALRRMLDNLARRRDEDSAGDEE